jgi:hypothetical protein
VEFVEASKRGIVPAAERRGRAPTETPEEEMS